MSRLQLLTQLPRRVNPRGVKDRLEDLLAVNDTRGINKHVWHLDRSIFLNYRWW